MTSERIVFKGGIIVLPGHLMKGSLIVEGEKVAGLEQNENYSGCKIIDCSGKVLLPGVIDTHVHMWDPSPMNYREDWYHGSRCAAAGGITTVIDMPLSVPPVIDREGFELKHHVASRDSAVDFAFWGGLIPSCLNNLKELDQLGCVAYKGFMSFANPDYPQITDGYLARGMKEAAKFNGLIGVHAENAEVADFGAKELTASGCPDESKYNDARPWWAELEAIQRAVLFSKAIGSRLYICHMSIAEGAEFLKKAKCEGTDVSVETCPHYLLFDNSILREKKAYAKCNPPLRSRENVEKLWQYVLDGTIDTIGSDHGPYSDEEKVSQNNFWEELCGFGGYDAMLPMLISEGVNRRGLGLERLAELTSGNAARIMGLFPKKGRLFPGFDADIAVVDLKEEWIYDGLKTFSKTKSANNIYHNMKMKGRVKQTWVRGRMVYDGEKITAGAGPGQYIPKQG
jgi:allantoinase